MKKGEKRAQGAAPAEMSEREARISKMILQKRRADAAKAAEPAEE